MASFVEELNNLDFEDVGSWPLVIKIISIVLLSAAVIGMGYYFQTQHTLVSLKQVEAKEKELKEVFKSKQAKAANLEKYKEQLAQMEQSFGEMLRQLPNKAEVAELLVDVSQTGLANGLEFELFQPSQESTREFYAEMPVRIRVTGEYHDFATFVSDVAALPRIVTIHDIAIEPRQRTAKSKDKKEATGGSLVMDATAKTYRYLDEEEDEANAAKPANKPATAKK